MPTGLIGSYKVMLDAKNRFNIPAPFKRYFDGLGDSSEQVTIRRVTNQKDSSSFIQVYPSDYFNKRVNQQFESLDPFDPETEEKRRAIFANSFSGEIKHNRILLSQNAIEHGSLNGQIWVVGMFDYFEIWSLEEGDQRFTAVT